jgi:hypothetical protein
MGKGTAGLFYKPLQRKNEAMFRGYSQFRLFGNGCVGSQSLTGIARLHQLRNNPKLAAVSAVWPFETGWATKANWLPKHVSILHAEGIVSKRLGSPYRSGRSAHWVKVKNPAAPAVKREAEED